MSSTRSGGLLARSLTSLERPAIVYLAAACTVVLGLFFAFVWSPLPFGWLGIDHYDDRALRLAHGEPFDTTDVPWGYAYYLAFFYLVFGHHLWVPILAQVLLNGLVPVLLYRLVRPLAGVRVAALAAILVGLFSFNTVYTSTQSSDAVCTVLFLASLVCFDRGRQDDRVWLLAASGLLMGVATQFRPNLILFPAVLAFAHAWHRPRTMKALRGAIAYLAVVGLALVPWIVRNYRLTGEFLPTSTHGGYQLWLGTLEMGAYLEQRPHNPRSLFEAPPFDYTSLAGRTLVVTADADACDPAPLLVYWTDRDRTRRSVPAVAGPSGRIAFEVPGQPAPTVVYYYTDAAPAAGSVVRRFTPLEGAANPFVFFVSIDHLLDPDRHHDVVDVFDLVRLLRHQAWNEPLPDGLLFDLTGDGRVDERDTRATVERLVRRADPAAGNVVRSIEQRPESVVLHLTDGSSLGVPLAFSGRITDLVPTEGLAARLLYSRMTRAQLKLEPEKPLTGVCGTIDHVAVNDVFYRQEPHLMRRYTALAWDNIRRNPADFALASLYRVVRLFIIRGSSDRHTAQQFTASSLIYAGGFIASVTILVAFLAGSWVAVRRQSRVRWLLLPIVYVPATICFVLTNMRYSITVQPYVFTFVAVAVVAWLERRTGDDREPGRRDRV